MKRKRGAPKALTDVENAVFILPTEPEKPEPEPEDPGVAEWNAFAQDHYELVEQLPLSLHRSFSLIRELDDLVQENTSRIVPATRAYIALRESMLHRPKHAEHSPSGLDLLAHVSAAVEPPAQSSVPALPGQEPGPAPNPVPNLAPTPPPAQPNGVVPMDEDKTPAEAPADPAPISSGPPADPVQHSADLAPAHPALVPPAPSFPTDSRALLTLIATLASDAVRASNEKVGIANTVYQTVDNHLQALDALIAQHKSTLPHQPSPDPIPPPLQHSPAPSSPTPSSPTKSRSRRRTRATEEKEPPGDEADGEDEQQSIPPLRITRTNGTTPTAVRVRSRSVSKPKPRDQVEDGASGSPTRKGKNVFPPKGSSNSGSSKGNSASSRNPQKLPPNSSNNQPRGTTIVPVPKTPRRNGKKSGTDGDDKYKRYCFCGDMSFGEMIACDNNCEREWFHLPCVGLEVAPKSKWYCNDCDPQNNPNSKKKQRKS